VAGLTRRAAFLDRDGTLNVRPPEHEYVTRVHDFVWLAGAAEAMALLHHAGFVLAVVSNQAGVASGRVSLTALRQIEARIQRDLDELDCRVTAFRYCFHAVDEACACRKPRPGMLHELARDLGVNLDQSWMIGDAESDIAAGSAAGCQTAFIGSAAAAVDAGIVAPSLVEASRQIIRATLVATVD
jgi:histidinol-phosphate phosphatase family protein